LISQGRQTVWLGAAAVPGPHGVQEHAPGDATSVTGHGLHNSPPVEYDPPAHCVQLFALGVDSNPHPQGKHSVAPELTEYDPGKHF